MTKSNSQYIPFPSSNNDEPLRLLTLGEFNEHKEEFNKQKSILNWTLGFIVATLVVVFIAFITFLLDSWKFHTEKTEQFNSIVLEYQKDKSKREFDELERRINQIEAERNIRKK